MGLIQHKKEAYWFYRFVSPVYDRWVNPLFWTPEQRGAALRLAQLGDVFADPMTAHAVDSYRQDRTSRS